MESLCYQEDAGTIIVVDKLRKEFIRKVQTNPNGREDDVLQINNAVKYLVKHQRMQEDHQDVEILKKIIKDNGWKTPDK